MTLRVLPVVLGAVLTASPALAGEAIRHSGPIVSENARQDTITIAEMGPWHGPNTRPVRREFHLTPGTRVELALRKNELGAFKGAFAERPMKTTDLRQGDYATLTVEREAGKPVATAVEVVRPSSMTRTPSPVRANPHATKTAANHVE